MNKKTKAFLYNFFGFTPFYILAYFIIFNFSSLQGWWIAITSAVIATLLSPKFQAITTNEGEKLFMKWLFIKGVKELK